ncbi:N-acetylmuramoyl-L-alanine amidase [Arboricoccus pini]|uniref:N-acetylmuramoyl-L-alanine amidase n=1 Tax=Arboricoccus pini TaxID=1963835 RepID=A0A212Q9X5_9PROT|nr:N-acetylmuramoyl-L-alanine amidase [Arboricoccus pini]SNB56097.1 N-acetylmuramoyl-L-alanine amidase [Arboricoccus pini]
MLMIEAPSPNWDAREQGRIDMIVLHYTGMPSGAEALARLRDPVAKVSAHFLLEEDGRLFRLVAETERAWHAGVSYWQGQERLNDVSIGIEIVNPGHEFGYRPFPDVQMRRLRTLLDDLVARFHIRPDRVLAHSDIAPDRKEDPGELFDWQVLARAGIGLWPEVGAGDGARGDVADLLAAIGYRRPHDPVSLRTALVAFQRHWHPYAVDGQADESTLERLAAVADAVSRVACGEPR